MKKTIKEAWCHMINASSLTGSLALTTTVFLFFFKERDHRSCGWSRVLGSMWGGGLGFLVSLGLHGFLHLVHHPHRNRKWLQLIHPNIWTVPEQAHTDVTMVTTHTLTYAGGYHGGRLTCTRHCGTDPGCPPQSAGRPEDRNRTWFLQLKLRLTANTTNHFLLPKPNCSVQAAELVFSYETPMYKENATKPLMYKSKRKWFHGSLTLLGEVNIK